MKNIAFAAFVLVSAAMQAAAQQVTWHNKFDLYADDVESFTKWRIDGTVLSSQWKSWLDWNVTSNSYVQTGFLFMYESGSGNFNTNQSFPIPYMPNTSQFSRGTNQSPDALMPVLSWRYKTDTALGIIGTIETVNRHGYIEPIQMEQLDFERPIEYGAQWLQNSDRLRLDAFISWLRLLQYNPDQREQFITGLVGEFDAASHFALEAQVENFHQGGENLNTNVAGFVSNNTVGAVGGKLHGNLGALGDSSLAVWGLGSNDTFYVIGDNGGKQGSALFVKGTVTPGGKFQLFASEFRARDFITADGDPNYTAQYKENTFADGLGLGWKTNRYVEELGIRKEVDLGPRVRFEAEERNQWVDGYFVWQFRLVGRLKFDHLLWSWD